MVEFIPVASSLAQALVAASGTLANLALRIELYQGDSQPILGMCLEGPCTGMALKIVAHDQDVVAADFTLPTAITCYATEGNPLRLPVGTKLVLSIGEDKVEVDGRRETIGVAFDGAFRSLIVELIVCGATQKARSQLKRVTVPDGTVLNREMSIRAFCAWLDYQNKMHAHKFGLTQLVWCVHTTKSGGMRLGVTQTRAFWRYDFADGMEKVCANINSAIFHMEKMIDRSFLEDMRNEGDKYQY